MYSYCRHKNALLLEYVEQKLILITSHKAKNQTNPVLEYTV